MPNFSPLAWMIWEEKEEVTGGRIDTGHHAFIDPIQQMQNLQVNIYYIGHYNKNPWTYVQT